MLEYGTCGISVKLYGLPIEMTRLSILLLELSDLQKMAIFRCWIQSTEKAHWYLECYYWRESCNTTDTIVNLTDSGNLVLHGYSYEYGNVTSLGMLLWYGKSLTSWRGRDDPGSGNFAFMVDTAGNQNAIIVDKEETTTIYWKISVFFYDVLTTTEVQKDYNFENARLVMYFTGKIV